jgi:hypothetical protein
MPYDFKLIAHSMRRLGIVVDDRHARDGLAYGGDAGHGSSRGLEAWPPAWLLRRAHCSDLSAEGESFRETMACARGKSRKRVTETRVILLGYL